MNDRKRKILLVEDEPNLAFNLKFNLEAEGLEVVHADTGLKAIEFYENQGPFDLIMLDVMLPELDGFEVAKKIRETDDRTGILMLTALAKDSDRINGLECGVDDYITKPFHLEELILRVQRMLRRATYFGLAGIDGPEEQTVTCGPFSIDIEGLILTSPKGPQTLTALEADVLVQFLKNPEKVLSREYLLDTVWGVKGNVETRTVDNFIVRLRKYIEEDPAKPKYLKSIRGRGYKFESN